MTDDAGPAPLARLFIRHMCVGWKLRHPWLFCSAASSPRPSKSLGFNLPCFLCIYSTVFLNPARLICSGSVLGQALTRSLAQAQDTHSGERSAGKRFVHRLPWYRVCGMKKSVIIAKWKGKEKRQWGKEKKKAKLNKWHFSTFNLKHRARGKLGEDSACFSSDGFYFLDSSWNSFTLRQTCLSFGDRRTELKVSIIVKSENRWHRKQEWVSMKSD